jgi:hypothetical protein
VTYNIAVAVLALGLLAIGHWGRRHVDELVPSTFSLATRQSKRRQYQRGATTCQIVAVLMLLYAGARTWASLHGADA